MDLRVDPAAVVEELPLPLRQLIEITRALAQEAAILVMDEPTSSLTETEVEALFRAVKGAAKGGCGIVYISHKLEEIYRIADRITVLRDGRKVCTERAADLPREELIRRMVGREIGVQFPWRSVEPGEELLSLRGLSRAGRGRSGSPLRGVSLTLRRGEVVGLAGLQGCGASEILQAIFGALEGVSGEILIGGRSAGALTPARAISRGVALQTNDRKATGLIMEMSITANTTLASLRRFSPGGWLAQSRERQAALRQGAALRLKASSPDQEAGVLSGGNQQKVVFAKWLETDPSVLLLDDPTRGIDVGSKFEVYELITSLKEKGCGILMVSSELPELLGLSDRILVLREGSVVREIARPEFSQETILRAALMREEPPDA
jgi:ABC-type sugar transport system ATPase subunit